MRGPVRNHYNGLPADCLTPHVGRQTVWTRHVTLRRAARFNDPSRYYYHYQSTISACPLLVCVCSLVSPRDYAETDANCWRFTAGWYVARGLRLWFSRFLEVVWDAICYCDSYRQPTIKHSFRWRFYFKLFELFVLC